MTVYDRLYGLLKFSENDWRLFQTPEMTRLRQVSLSAIPPWCLPAGVCASKFEHSLAVGHLARIVGRIDGFEEMARDLFFAALAHDMGTPPFSHLSEHFGRRLLGKDHEELAADIVQDSEFGEVVLRQGGSIEQVIGLITGKLHPWGVTLNGSIDLDNLDNSLRYGYSLGLFRRLIYSPERIAELFCLRDGRVCLTQDVCRFLPQWENCRKTVYRFVYSSANLSPAMMIFRAVDLACRQDEIDDDYFRLTDMEAFNHLENSCNPKTKRLMRRARLWQFYPRVFNFKASSPSENLERFTEDLTARGRLADEIAETLGIPPEDICVYVGKDKGYKQIHLPLVDENGRVFPAPTTSLEPSSKVQVYLNPQLVNQENITRISSYLEDTFGAELL